MASILEELYKGDEGLVINYMRKHDSVAMRKVMLVTDKFRLTYCYNVCARRSVFRKIFDKEVRKDARYDCVRRWLKYNKPSSQKTRLRKPVRASRDFSENAYWPIPNVEVVRD